MKKDKDFLFLILNQYDGFAAFNIIKNIIRFRFVDFDANHPLACDVQEISSAL